MTWGDVKYIYIFIIDKIIISAFLTYFFSYVVNVVYKRRRIQKYKKDIVDMNKRLAT